jgi:hypothetical protein
MPRGNQSKSELRTAAIVIVLLGVLVVAGTGVVVLWNDYGAPYFHLAPISFGAPANTGPSTQPITNQPTTQKIDLVLWDNFGGAGIASQTIVITDHSTNQQVDSVTSGTGGAITTNAKVTSGQVLDFYVADGNAKWFTEWTVPNAYQGQDAATNPNFYLKLPGFTAETFTDLSSIGGTNINDGGTYNFTAPSGAATGTITYSWSAVTDNKAILGSGFSDQASGFVNPTINDPIYGMPMHDMLFVVISGNAWSKVNINSMDGSYVVGTTKVFYKALDSVNFVSYKQGNTYIHTGDGSVPIPFDATGISNTVTIQLYIVAYANGAYASLHSATDATASPTDFGPRAVQLAEQTISGIV